MNILVVNGSPRTDGNTSVMTEVFAEEARRNGCEVSVVSLAQTHVAPCLDCVYCFSHDGECVQKDGMAEIFRLMDRADTVVIASPIYYFGLTAQTVAFIDRLYARSRIGYHPSAAALLLDSGSPGVFDGAVAQYQSTISYLKWKNRGIVTISGMGKKGSMRTSPDLTKVRQLAADMK